MDRISLLTHLAFVLVHGGLEPEEGFGGCNCDQCNDLRAMMKKIRTEEANEAAR